MSRICVKNLPKYANEERLREFFSQKGEVTDAKVMRTSDGKSRQFAFVGFRTDDEANAAITYFNNTYMDTWKITCEVARKVGDMTLPRPWSRHSLKKEATNPQQKKDIGVLNSCQAKVSDSEDLSDPKLQEFLHVMQPRSKSKIWENDINGMEQEVKAEEKKPRKKKSKAKKIESPSKITKSSQEEDTGEEKPKDEAVTDMDYFRSRVKENWSDSESDSELDSDSESESESNKELEPETVSRSEPEMENESGKELHLESELDLKHIERDGGDKSCSDSEDPSDERKLVLDTGRLFVRNLPYTATENELRELFSQHGDVSQVHLVVDKDSRRSKGIGYVLFASPESAVRAFEELDNSIFQGRLLHVMAAKPQKNDKTDVDVGVKKSLKTVREEQRKAAEASGDTRSWNSLFIRQDTAMENIARKHGISKSELVGREAEDPAVRVSLAETQTIADTKRSLSNLGVNVAVLEDFAAKKIGSTKRSNNIILIKNLPYSCSEGELVTMFSKFGSLDKVILPPSRTLALVIYLEPAEAHKAITLLAYRLYKGSPLYLEWAPENILSQTAPVCQEETNNVLAVEEKLAKKVLLDQSLGVHEEEIDLDRVESRSLFVKNLNFSTTDESLKQHFSNIIKCGTIRSVKIKKHLKNGKNLSMGFGFIEVDSVETATNVLKEHQGTVLDDHRLILQLCHAKKEGVVPKKEGKEYSSTKLIIRNVAFGATAKEIKQLFSPFGQIKSVRLPMKFGTHRGFAFVEYITKQEAHNAMQSLSNTHFYGRHLVIERAKEGESLEELRERTAAQFVDETSGFKSLSRKRKQEGLVDDGSVKLSRIVE